MRFLQGLSEFRVRNLVANFYQRRTGEATACAPESSVDATRPTRGTGRTTGIDERVNYLEIRYKDCAVLMARNRVRNAA
jgi:hypothetical protein